MAAEFPFDPDADELVACTTVKSPGLRLRGELDAVVVEERGNGFAMVAVRTSRTEGVIVGAEVEAAGAGAQTLPLQPYWHVWYTWLAHELDWK